MELFVVDGVSVGFDYRLRPGDRLVLDAIPLPGNGPVPAAHAILHTLGFDRRMIYLVRPLA